MYIISKRTCMRHVNYAAAVLASAVFISFFSVCDSYAADSVLYKDPVRICRGLPDLGDGIDSDTEDTVPETANPVEAVSPEENNTDAEYSMESGNAVPGDDISDTGIERESSSDGSISAKEDIEENVEEEETIRILGAEYPVCVSRLDLSGIKSINVPTVLKKLGTLEKLEYVVLSAGPADDGSITDNRGITFDEFRLFADSLPDVRFEYTFDLYGETVSTTRTSEIMFKKVDSIDDSALEYIDTVIPYLYSVDKISFDRCAASYEALDALRNKYPDIVRWRVFFGSCCAWSDTDRIWAMASLYHDEDSENMKYFRDLRYLDIGHSGLTTCEFLYSMPELEVLIMACGDMTDITPVGSLSKLTYLEIADSLVSDISVLADCTALEHLNMGGTYVTDLSPLYELKNLKRLYINYPRRLTEADMIENFEIFSELMPYTEINFEMYPGGGTLNDRWRFSRGSYAGSYVPTYQWIREIFGYDSDYNQAKLFDW